MPPKSRLSSRDLVEQEGRIQLAISALKNNEIPSVRRAAEVFNVPKSTLHDRLTGHHFRIEQRANGHRLSQTQEDALIQWILSRDSRGVPPRPSHVQEMANIILRTDNPTGYTPIGKNWVSALIKRRDEIRSQFARKYNYERAKCEDPKVIQQWFEQLQKVRLQYGILDEDIFNFDETGFAMGVIATTKVVSRSNMPGKPHLIQPGNREWVTTIECINSSGWSLPSCIIFKGKVHIEGWFDEGLLPSDWRIEISQNGWTTDEIGLRWLQKVFIPSTSSRTVGRYRLLVLDGHGSHLTPAFDKACSDNNIIAICMPPHSSHLLQPLDVGCFGPLKRAYGGLVESKMRLGFNHIDKLDFLKAYPIARQEVFKAQNIQNGFAAAGIYPFDPQRVLDKLNIKLSTPTPPGSRSGHSTSSSTLATPHTIRQLHKQASSVKKLLKKGSQSPSTPSKRALQQIIKGCEIALYNAAILAQENHDLRMANEKEKQKRGRSRRQMSPNQGLSVQEARDLIHQRNEQGDEIQEIAMGSASLPSNAPRRAPPTCSNCHIQGHIRTGCPTRLNI
ncbi:Transposase [Rasamsonia emersonii CBS 393.64]|uniref:Transposase n=1 Tax=Rasamsonia emersonii (strain ATCC 16479 / CBS 393.64 / IMI 116815) TaxID=1408163 RepID=A0A0F4YWI5_RASE3|nr:Transposase [Rasamsonia emersonii CBS 393.64]KKA22460.1 Transposase [Rasamsonia emersonii CBS 393.64]